MPTAWQSCSRPSWLQAAMPIRARNRPWLRRSGQPAEGVVATDHLAELYPPAEAFRSRGSGLLALTVSAEMPWLLLWFRAEQIETINWAGNPHRFDASDPAAELRPRASFEASQETVRGRARPWTLAEVNSANRLRSALMEVRQTRKMHALNRRLTGILRDKDVLLEQKEALVQEVNHRVQNSLQLVSSFLSLQARPPGVLRCTPHWRRPGAACMPSVWFTEGSIVATKFT